MSELISNSLKTLNVSADATPDELRNAYLNLVRQHPPDRDADKFREIHAAYQLLCNPMLQADAILSPAKVKPDLATLISSAEKIRPRLTTLNLLALGNLEVSTNEGKQPE
jgi:DnaJ domain